MKKRAEIILFVLGLIVILLVGLNASRYFLRIDLTENKAFTISRVSRELFRDIPDRVFLTYYVSDKLKSLYAFPLQIEDLLYEYAAYSRGSIKVEVVDPVRSGSLTQAESLGVFPQQIEVIEQDERSFAQVYTGIVIQYLDRYETIPVVSQVESLEYDLTSRIRKIVTEEERSVGFLAGDASRDLQNDFSSLLATLTADFSVRPIGRGEDIPEDLDVLFVLGARDLDDFDLFPIDQYIMDGGRVLFAVEGMDLDLMRGIVPRKLDNTQILSMLQNYGVTVQQAFVLDTYAKNFRIPRQILGQIMWEVMEKYPYWITVANRFVSRENPITARFQGLDLLWASPLDIVERSGVEAQVLLNTTPEAWILDKEPFETNPQRAVMLEYMSQENKDQYALGVTLRGTFPSYFAGREIPERVGEERNWQQVVERSEETRLVVVGDADFASELYQYSGGNYNLEFLANAAEWLSNSEDLLEIKTRVARDMRLNKIQDPETRFRAAMFTQMFNLIVIPLLVVVFGVLRLILRRRKGVIREQEG
ncbi:MAG: GldG family protein [Spirochaetaceae bacterium]|nr:MAG: GldG family protein [Spirochaetaceae bacterium]